MDGPTTRSWLNRMKETKLSSTLASFTLGILVVALPNVHAFLCAIMQACTFKIGEHARARWPRGSSHAGTHVPVCAHPFVSACTDVCVSCRQHATAAARVLRCRSRLQSTLPRLFFAR